MSGHLNASRRLLEEVWSKGNFAVIDDLVDANYVNHDPNAAQLPPGREGMKQFAMAYRSAFPDLSMTVEDQVAEGDKVVTRWCARGTHKGALPGLPATGKSATVTGIGIDRIVNGKIVESWGNWDQFGMLRQLGAIPPEQ